MQLPYVRNNGTSLCNNGMETISHNQCKKTYCGISGRTINFFCQEKLSYLTFRKTFFLHTIKYKKIELYGIER